MRGNLLALGLVIAVLAVSAGAASASPAVQRAPWETDPGALENLSGHLDMYLKDQAIILDLRAQAGGAVDRQFTVKVSDSAGLLPSSFHSDAARVVVWTGHLVVIADREAQVFHFSVAGFDPPDLSSERHELPAGAQEAASAPASGYKMTRLTGAKAILSNTPAEARSLFPRGIMPGASFLMDCCATGDSSCCLDYQNYGSGGGGCSSSCTVTCTTGSTCSATCNSGTCAACSCNSGNPICHCF
jgi:hypothetical protein